MNKVILIGRLTSDPDIRMGGQENDLCIAAYTLAVDREYAREGQTDADFIRCKAFGKRAEFAEKYLCKGIKIAVCGRIQTGSYEKEDGTKVYTTDVMVESQEFCESKAVNEKNRGASGHETPANVDDDGFINVPDGINEELPFA